MNIPTTITRIELELTEKCNLSCEFCYNTCAPVFCDKPEWIMKHLADLGVMELILTGGEPSLHPQFIEVLKLACSMFPRVMVQSNGVLFSDEKFWNKVIQNPIFCFNFSLHGSELIHDSLTNVKSSFLSTTRALSMAVKAGFRTASNLVLTRKNAGQKCLEYVVDHLESIGVREMTITRFIPNGAGQQNAKHLSLNSKDFCTSLETLIRATSKKKISLLLANATPACLIPEHLVQLCSRCSFGYDKFYIDVKGNVLVCGMSRVPIGKLENGQNKFLFSEIRKRYYEMSHVPEKCTECNLFEICGGGCRAAALAGDQNLFGFDRLEFF